MAALEIIVAVGLVLLGCYLSAVAWRASRTARRLRRGETRKIVALVEGPAAVVGELRAAHPLADFDGTPCVLLRRWFRCLYGTGEENRAVDVSLTECADARASDETGECAVDLDHMVVLAPTTRRVFTGKDFEELYPKLWSEVLGIEAGADVDKLVTEETVIPDGARVFVYGEAVSAAAPGEDETFARRRRFRIRGTPDRPLVLACGDRKAALRVLRAPVLALVWVAFLCFVVGALAVAIPLFLEARAGL